MRLTLAPREHAERRSPPSAELQGEPLSAHNRPLMRPIITPGYLHPLYLLPFDHRHSYLTGMFGLEPPLAQADIDRVADSKQIIYEGFRQALAGDVPKGCGGILVDEGFGADILRDAVARGYVTALSVEKSGSDEFDFEYGAGFADHIRQFSPTFAKVLVRYNPQGDVVLNERQIAKLRKVSDVCREGDRDSCSSCWCQRRPKRWRGCRETSRPTILKCARA